MMPVYSSPGGSCLTPRRWNLRIAPRNELRSARNDRDGDGDALSGLAVTAPAHGSAVVSPGGESSTPQPDYHGSDRFAYTVGDGKGLTAGAAVDATVLPVNDPPEAVGAIPDQQLEVGDRR